MKKDAKEILNYDIVPDVGLGEIHFGMTKDEIWEKYNIEEYINDDKSSLVLDDEDEGGGIGIYLFDESIILYFTDEGNFSLVSILVQNQFKGTYLNKISIDTPFSELYNLKEDEMSYDDELYFPEGKYTFYVELDSDEFEEKFGYYPHETTIYGIADEMSKIKIDSIFIRKDIEDILKEKN